MNAAGGVSRREAIRTLATAGLLALGGRRLGAQSGGAAGPAREAVARYLATLARDDGGYGFHGQNRSHPTATWAVVGSLRLLQQEPGNRRALLDFLHGFDPGVLKRVGHDDRLFLWQQVQALRWLGDPATDFAARVQALQ